MQIEPATARFYHSPGWGRDYSLIQILTSEELLWGGEVRMPPEYSMFKQAQRGQHLAIEQLRPEVELGV